MFNLKARLARAREGLGRVFQSGPASSAVDLDEIEALLLSADVGVDATDRALDALRQRGSAQPRAVLREIFLDILETETAADAATARPRAILVVGINGAGKTTSIGKLAHLFRSRGETVLLAASDTFRAAAADQLGVWAQRVGVEMIRHDEGGDPGAVAFDACEAAKARGADVVIVDTAGRLHTRTNLMDELEKVRRVCERALGAGAVHTLLVIDATLGQNSLTQASEFSRRLHADGIILTKLDSTAKGGIAIAIRETLGIPVRYIGVGEGLDDFGEFSPPEFIDALLG